MKLKKLPSIADTQLDRMFTSEYTEQSKSISGKVFIEKEPTGREIQSSKTITRKENEKTPERYRQKEGNRLNAEKKQKERNKKVRREKERCCDKIYM